MFDAVVSELHPKLRDLSSSSRVDIVGNGSSAVLQGPIGARHMYTMRAPIGPCNTAEGAILFAPELNEISFRLKSKLLHGMTKLIVIPKNYHESSYTVRYCLYIVLFKFFREEKK